MKWALRILRCTAACGCLVFCAGQSFADHVTQAPKKQIRVRKTECFVVATEAKRLFQTYPQPDPFAREFYARISENYNKRISVLGYNFYVLDQIGVDNGRDVLGGAVLPPSGGGWRPQYRDGDYPLTGTQRHHYGFYFFTAACDGGPEFVKALFGNLLNDIHDFMTDNDGDLMLADEAIRQGALARAGGYGTESVWGQVKGVLCEP
jgi:hypothetical protein